MNMPNHKEPSPNVTWKDAPTRSVDVGGTKFVYRRLGPVTGVPVIFLNHLAAAGGIPASSMASPRDAA